jgi:hypothetical protein
MASRDDYMKVARQIAEYCNSFRLAFKTYQISEFDAMMKAIAGEGGRVSSGDNAELLQAVLLERGFMVFPSINESENGYSRCEPVGRISLCRAERRRRACGPLESSQTSNS